MSDVPSSVPSLVSRISSTSGSASPSEFNLGGVPNAALGLTIGASGIRTGVFFFSLRNSVCISSHGTVLLAPSSFAYDIQNC